MSESLIIVWFILGILACHLDAAIDLKKGMKASPEMVWMSILGPVGLLIVIIATIVE